MSDRLIPPPRRTLGQLKDSPGQQRPPEMPGGFDASSGQRMPPEIARNEMEALLQQNGAMPSAGAPRRQQNVQERVMELPVDRAGDDVPYEDTPRAATGGVPRQRRTAGTNQTSNNTEGDVRAPPPIQPAQYAARRKPNRGEDVVEPTEKQSVHVGKPRFVLKQIDRDPSFQRVPLLSGFVFYDFKDLQARKLNIHDQAKISKSQQTRNLTDFIDAVGATLSDGTDIRDLAVPDFYYLLYWHRFNSYTTTPFIVTWTSKYGNSNQYKITDTSLKYQAPTISEESYATWKQLGFAIPTVRDLEVFNTEELNDEERYIFTRAQYFAGIPSEDGGPIDIQDKVDHMTEMCADSLDALEQLSAFKKELEFGVIERVDVTDAKFDPEKWANALIQQAEYLRIEADAIRTINPGGYVARMAEAEEAEREATTISQRLEQGDKVLPDVEVITLDVGILEFFPDL